jgi:hypothetical protein
MAYLWAWDDDPDPMIDRPVGLRQPNESTDVFLVEALLVAIYEKTPKRPVPVLPMPGTAWGDIEDAYIADFQTFFVKQKRPTGIVSPTPPSMHYRTAVMKKYTMAHLIQAARIMVSYNEGSQLVPFLIKRFPFLKGPLGVIRNRKGVMPGETGMAENFGGEGTETGTHVRGEHDPLPSEITR